MDRDKKDAGVLQALAERMESQRLPRALSIKKRVDKGDPLNELDIQHLKEVLEDAQRAMPLMERHPEWQSLAASLINLYKEIIDKALENEQNQSAKH